MMIDEISPDHAPNARRCTMVIGRAKRLLIDYGFRLAFAAFDNRPLKFAEFEESRIADRLFTFRPLLALMRWSISVWSAFKTILATWITKGKASRRWVVWIMPTEDVTGQLVTTDYTSDRVARSSRSLSCAHRAVRLTICWVRFERGWLKSQRAIIGDNAHQTYGRRLD